MRNFVVSDLHGCFTRFNHLLKELNFSKDDCLYINGDIIDRGSESSELVDFLFNNSNVHLIAGNHEMLFYQAYPAFRENIDFLYANINFVGMRFVNDSALPDDSYLLNEYNTFSEKAKELLNNIYLFLWFQNGGKSTFTSFYKHYKETGINMFEKFYNYLDENALTYALVDKYIISHTGGQKMLAFEPTPQAIHKHFTPCDSSLDASLDETNFYWTRSLWEVALRSTGSFWQYNNYFNVIGHTPISKLCSTYDKHKIDYSKIYKFKETEDFKSGLICIDFGTFKNDIVGILELGSGLLHLSYEDTCKCMVTSLVRDHKKGENLNLLEKSTISKGF